MSRSQMTFSRLWLIDVAAEAVCLLPTQMLQSSAVSYQPATEHPFKSRITTGWPLADLQPPAGPTGASTRSVTRLEAKLGMKLEAEPGFPMPRIAWTFQLPDLERQGAFATAWLSSGKVSNA